MLIQKYVQLITNNNFVRIVLIWIALDTMLGCLRAFREHRFNSSAGIDGAIRKVAMIISIAFLMLVDTIVGINVINWVPESMASNFRITKLGIGEFFSVLFILFESVSILKNMMLCGLPIPAWLKRYIEMFLTNLTTELPKNKMKP